MATGSCEYAYQCVLSLGLGESAVDDHADLTTCSVVVRAESTVRVATDDAVVVSRFYKGVERVSSGYVCEVRTTRSVDSPPFCLHDDLGQLSSGDVVAPAEGAVRIAGDEPSVVRR